MPEANRLTMPREPQRDDEPDSALIAASIAGDLQAFERLYRRHSARVYGLCVRLTRNQTDAEDCTQDTFIKAWHELGRFRGQSSLATWLHRIAVNEVLSRQRRASTEERHLKVVRLEQDSPQQPRRAEMLDIEQAIAQLPARARMAFVLNKIYGYTHNEAAEMLDIAPGTCKAQVFRASRTLASLLGHEPGGPEAAADDTGPGGLQ